LHNCFLKIDLFVTAPFVLHFDADTTTLDNVTDSDLLDTSFSLLESAKQPQPFLSLGAHPAPHDSDPVPSSTLLTCKAMHLQAAKRKPNLIATSSSTTSPNASFKVERPQQESRTTLLDRNKSADSKGALMSASIPQANRSSFCISNARSSVRSNGIKAQLQMSHDPLEEFQRIRSTLRKSVRKSSAAEPVRTRESLEPARKELTEIFQKIRNIKIN
jgi:hypothetical protein